MTAIRNIRILLIATALPTGILGMVRGEGPGWDSLPMPDFGMRARERPSRAERIEAPVLLAKAPTNESSMVRMPDGSLRIFFIDRPGTARRMMSVSSSDGGLRWSAPTVEAALPGEAYYANQVLLDGKGVLHAVFHIYDSGPLGYRGRHLDLWHMRKPPGGRWSEPKRIFVGYVGSVRSFIELRSGRLLIPMYEADTARARKPSQGPDRGLFGVVTLHSDDGGDSWRKSPERLDIEVDPEQVTRYGAVEPVAIELKDGRVWMLIRTNKGRLYESFSHDGGRGWSPPVPSRFISSDSPAGFLRLSDGRILLLTNACQRHDDPRSYANGGREALHAALSSDEGGHWTGFREVLVSPAAAPPPRGDRGTAYPSAVQTAEGKVILVSGQGAEAAIAGFDPDWLARRKEQDPSGTDPRRWTSHGASPRDRVFNFPMARKGRLALRFRMGEAPTGLRLALTDHFSIASDSLAAEEAPFLAQLPAASIRRGANRVRVRWDMASNSALLRVNGRRTGEKDYRACITENGYGYLRVTRATAPSPSSAGLRFGVRAKRLDGY